MNQWHGFWTRNGNGTCEEDNIGRQRLLMRSARVYSLLPTVKLNPIGSNKPLAPNRICCPPDIRGASVRSWQYDYSDGDKEPGATSLVESRTRDLSLVTSHERSAQAALIFHHTQSLIKPPNRDPTLTLLVLIRAVILSSTLRPFKHADSLCFGQTAQSERSIKQTRRVNHRA